MVEVPILATDRPLLGNGLGSSHQLSRIRPDILREAAKRPTTRGRPTSDCCVPPRLDVDWTERIQQLIERHPTFGYRRLWALLHFGPDPYQA
jgi:hypothetical protein